MCVVFLDIKGASHGLKKKKRHPLPFGTLGAQRSAVLTRGLDLLIPDATPFNSFLRPPCQSWRDLSSGAGQTHSGRRSGLPFSDREIRNFACFFSSCGGFRPPVPSVPTASFGHIVMLGLVPFFFRAPFIGSGFFAQQHFPLASDCHGLGKQLIEGRFSFPW